MISCQATNPYHETGTPPEKLMGYTAEKFQEGGMNFWFSRIHEEDLPMVSNEIMKAHKNLMGPHSDRKGPARMELIYRFRLPDGNYVLLNDIRYLLSNEGAGVIDDILCRIEPVNSGSIDNVLNDLLLKDKSCNKMLQSAIKYQEVQVPKLTKRELQILRLIAEGKSSKMIAEQCFISLNTVETHRRHLLEKMQVKNSVELIRQAAKIMVFRD